MITTMRLTLVLGGLGMCLAIAACGPASVGTSAATGPARTAAPASTQAATTAPASTAPSPQAATAAPAGTAPAPSSSSPPTAQALLTRLQTAAFSESGLPARLHVTGVGVWQYADAGHVGAGYLGSAQVRLRADLAGESVVSIYDVFTADADAVAAFDAAYTNFQRFSPGDFQILHLSPPAEAFCGPQAALANTTACWFTHGLATGIVTATVPSAAYRGDGPAVLQAMLTHLIALGG